MELKYKVLFNPMHNYLLLYRAPQMASMSSRVHWQKELSILILCIFVHWTHCSWLKIVRNYHFHICIILFQDICSRKIFYFLLGLEEKEKGFCVKCPQQYKQRNKLIIGSRKLLLKSLSGGRQLSLKWQSLKSAAYIAVLIHLAFLGR